MWIEKNGKTWRIRDLVAGQKVTVKAGYPNKTSAKAGLVEKLGEKMRGDQLVAGGGKMLLREWIAIWQPAWEASLKPSSAARSPPGSATTSCRCSASTRLEDIDAPGRAGVGGQAAPRQGADRARRPPPATVPEDDPQLPRHPPHDPGGGGGRRTG
jgi:hypothetical protein